MEALSDPNARVMLQLPTGGGKTRIAAALLSRLLSDGAKAVWLTHRTELSTQTCRVLNEACVRAVDLTKDWLIDDPAPSRKRGIVVLMAQTVARRNRYEGVWDDYNPEDLLIIDEAHHATAAGWERAIDQWPGRVVGLTATPWRLAKYEGFSHLFGQLIPGPQISKMQSEDWLARAQVFMPDQDELVLGGIPASNGEYSEIGIEEANRDRPHIMTGGALRFWQEHCRDRQTIVYAVSVKHAQNLADVFNDAGIPTGVMLGNTPTAERARLIRQFENGTIKALVNVSVATEGFDLPDAACVVMTRPTLSLALYLQMIGRGLRPKPNGGDCLILDLAGNVERHGLPDAERIWSLEPRSQQTAGDAPVVRCPECDGVSPAASRNCHFCKHPFGKKCQRCDLWQAWKRWTAEKLCGDDHDLVCNRCHLDAHYRANLPFEGELKAVLNRDLSEDGVEVNPSSLNTLGEARDRICEIAEQLVHAHRLDDSPRFIRLTEQLKRLFRREARLRKARLADAGSALTEKLSPILKEFTGALEQAGREHVTEVFFDLASGQILINGQEVELEELQLLQGVLARYKDELNDT